jgi:hypothetical protein
VAHDPDAGQLLVEDDEVSLVARSYLADPAAFAQ